MTNDGELHTVGHVSIKAEMKVDHLSQTRLLSSFPPVLSAPVVPLGL